MNKKNEPLLKTESSTGLLGPDLSVENKYKKSPKGFGGKTMNKKKKTRYATTKDLKDAVDDMVKDKLSLGARVELYFNNGNTRYEVVKISHYHAIPNLVLTIRKVKDNEAK